MVACQFGKYRFTRLPFGVVPVSDIFKWRIDEILKGLPNILCNVDDILIVGYDADGRYHDKTLRLVM